MGDWSTAGWLLQGVVTSFLSGVGFLCVTLALEHVKKYCRDKKQKERAELLEKFLRGDDIMNWKEDKSMVLVQSGRTLGRGETLTKESRLRYKHAAGSHRSHLINRGEKKGSRLESDMERSRDYPEWSILNLDSIKNNCGEDSKGSGTEDRMDVTNSGSVVVHLPKRKNISSATRGITGTGKSESVSRLGSTSHSIFTDTKLWSQQVEDASNDRQACVAKQVCGDLCRRMVSEYPFIAPFLRRDLLQELRIDLAEENETSPCTYANATSIGKNDPLRADSSAFSGEPGHSMTRKTKPEVKSRFMGESLKCRGDSPVSQRAGRTSARKSWSSPEKKALDGSGKTSKADSGTGGKTAIRSRPFSRVRSVEWPTTSASTKNRTYRSRSLSVMPVVRKSDASRLTSKGTRNRHPEGYVDETTKVAQEFSAHLLSERLREKISEVGSPVDHDVSASSAPTADVKPGVDVGYIVQGYLDENNEQGQHRYFSQDSDKYLSDSLKDEDSQEMLPNDISAAEKKQKNRKSKGVSFAYHEKKAIQYKLKSSQHDSHAKEKKPDTTTGSPAAKRLQDDENRPMRKAKFNRRRRYLIAKREPDNPEVSESSAVEEKSPGKIAGRPDRSPSTKPGGQSTSHPKSSDDVKKTKTYVHCSHIPVKQKNVSPTSKEIVEGKYLPLTIDEQTVTTKSKGKGKGKLVEKGVQSKREGDQLSNVSPKDTRESEEQSQEKKNDRRSSPDASSKSRHISPVQRLKRADKVEGSVKGPFSPGARKYRRMRLVKRPSMEHIKETLASNGKTPTVGSWSVDPNVPRRTKPARNSVAVGKTRRKPKAKKKAPKNSPLPKTPQETDDDDKSEASSEGDKEPDTPKTIQDYKVKVSQCRVLDAIGSVVTYHPKTKSKKKHKKDGSVTSSQSSVKVTALADIGHVVQESGTEDILSSEAGNISEMPAEVKFKDVRSPPAFMYEKIKSSTIKGKKNRSDFFCGYHEKTSSHVQSPTSNQVVEAGPGYFVLAKNYSLANNYSATSKYSLSSRRTSPLEDISDRSEPASGSSDAGFHTLPTSPVSHESLSGSNVSIARQPMTAAMANKVLGSKSGEGLGSRELGSQYIVLRKSALDDVVKSLRQTPSPPPSPKQAPSPPSYQEQSSSAGPPFVTYSYGSSGESVLKTSIRRVTTQLLSPKSVHSGKPTLKLSEKVSPPSEVSRNNDGNRSCGTHSSALPGLPSQEDSHPKRHRNKVKHAHL